MNDYLELFADWYPEFLGTYFYPVRVAKTFTLKERESLLQQLNESQKELLAHHRKYRIRSLFLKNSYMQSTQWRFSELKINPFYPEPLPDGTKLICKCGRPLKYQFILHSTKRKKPIALGINHFADHLNIPIEVAREIQKGVNEIDIALDELLWLKKNQVAFPEQVWQRYCYAVFRNNQLAKPIQLNQKLPKRIKDFRDAQMPIYISDYEALETEIRRVNQQAQGDTAHFLAEKTLFEAFYEDFMVDLATTNLYTHKKFLTKKSKLLLTTKLEKLPFVFFGELLHQLQSLPREKPGLAKMIFQEFSRTKGKIVDEEVLDVVLRMYLTHGFNQSFFLGIPKVMRNGLLKAIRIEKEEQKQAFDAKIATLPDVFFQSFAVLLKSPETLNQPDILQHYLTSILGEGSGYINLDSLLVAMRHYLAGKPFEIAYAEIEKQLYQRLAVVF
ncbi:hypothetical protein [Candidatus Enterococcus willemsii]|uniref:Uncharacterized protein n=1 Tax=Candidatus Enterococcus willemsii TaxID=1857215 RepID=A0ABQ6Z1G8_9ENTE|nr:hypothetical protein [Enterococcus sp. CU12B]KAF1305111.1 hypothetical protein BAU17_04865 [Enterococcus sp. CU12B]